MSDNQEPQTGGPPEDGGNEAAALHIPAPQPPVKRRTTLVYPMFLDGGFKAQLVLPANLSQSECQRLIAFIASLVVPWGEHS